MDHAAGRREAGSAGRSAGGGPRAFVLVHGAWHDGSCWAAVAAALEQAGHPVLTPTLAGHGPAASGPASIEDCWRTLADELHARDLRDFVLVGHSFGGCIVQKVAEAMAARIRRLVFVSAYVLHDGECMLELNPPAFQEVILRLAARSADGRFRLPLRIWRERFVNDADPALARASHARLSPQPLGPLREAVSLPRFFGLDIPCSFVHALDDRALPPGPQWGWHPRLSGRLRQCRVVQMPGGHETQFTDPSRLAATLVEAARDWAPAGARP